jgi:hypothetical protein
MVAFQMRGLGKYEKIRKAATAWLTSFRRTGAIPH